MELEAHVHDTIREIPESEWNALDGVSEDVLTAFRRSLDVLREVGTVEDTALPDLPWVKPLSR